MGSLGTGQTIINPMANIIPYNYKKLTGELKLNKEEVLLVDAIQDLFDNKSIGLVQLLSFPYQEQKFLLGLILKSKGIIFVKTVEVKNPDPKKILPKYNDEILEIATCDICNKLANHRQLQITSGNETFLKIPIKVIYYFPSLRRKKIDMPSLQNFLDRHVIFYDDLDESYDEPEKFKSLFTNNLDNANPAFEELSYDDIDAITQQICPEYTIPRYICEEIHPKKIPGIETVETIIPVQLSGEEFFVKAWQLENEQVHLVNSLLKQHQMLLACAGSGKSVILLSRAIKIAKIHPHKRILITFFNKPLQAFYEWRLGQAGINAKNVTCKSFHKFCRYLLTENNIPVPMQANFNDLDTFFDAIVDKTYEGIIDGSIKHRYYAVFIDEIQDFDPLWYKICYSLLEDPNDEHVLCICGDISQDIKGKIKKGGAPWHGDGLPSYRGRSINIVKNYRNSEEINKFATKFNNMCLEWAFQNNIEPHENDFLTGTSDRKTGFYPQIHYSDRTREKETAIEIIHELKSKFQIQFSDIAILYPYRKFGPLGYFIQYWLSTELQSNNIPYSFVSQSENEPTFYHYATRRGVTISPIDSTKGLDFSAIIICGLLPFSYINQQDNERLFVNMKKIYTAMTRAMKHLRIIAPDNVNNNPVVEMIVDAHGEAFE